MSRDTEKVQGVAYSPMNAEDAPEEAWLLDRAASGDIDAWGALLVLHQERLKSIVTFRLDPRLRGRIDAADVMQEAFIEATTRRAEFFQQSTQTLFLWLRWIVGNTLLDLHVGRARVVRESTAGGRAQIDPAQHAGRHAILRIDNCLLTLAVPALLLCRSRPRLTAQCRW